MQADILGNIHSVETFGTLDGPGIRFVVFMQGCALQCKYCHNRDTWSKTINTQMSVQELTDQICKYKTYFEVSGGGVTITGGEPLLQIDFLIELFKHLKSLNIHTAIDTSGIFAITDKVKELLKLTDLILLDIKHINSEKCKELVGAPNELEIEFAKYLSDNNIPIWIRQVIIPGITDDENDLIDLKNFIKSLKTVKKVELSAYHNMGKYKWKQMNLEYPLENVRTATEEDIQRAKKILEL